MIKRFCDACEQEITTENHCRDNALAGTHNKLVLVEGEKRSLPFRIEVKVELAAEGHGKPMIELCLWCVVDLMSKLDSRPKMAR